MVYKQRYKYAGEDFENTFIPNNNWNVPQDW
jgi:hypothetical protein